MRSLLEYTPEYAQCSGHRITLVDLLPQERISPILNVRLERNPSLGIDFVLHMPRVFGLDRRVVIGSRER